MAKRYEKAGDRWYEVSGSGRLVPVDDRPSKASKEFARWQKNRRAKLKNAKGKKTSGSSY